MTKNKHQKKPEEHRKIALERVYILFEQAFKKYKEEPALSDRYVKLARKIAMKYKVKIPSKYRRQFCKHCYSYFMPGKSCRVRLHGDNIIYTCFKCRKYTKFRHKC